MIREIRFRKSYDFLLNKKSQKRFPVKTIKPSKYTREKKPYKMFEIFSEGFSMELKDVNIIVGENGSGKSTLISLIKNYAGRPMDELAISIHKTTEGEHIENIIEDQKKGEIDIISDVDITYKNCVFFDAEADNPTVSVPKKINPYEKGFGEMVAFMWDVNEESHGESMIPILDYILDNVGNGIIFMDEPETALSLGNQVRLAKKIKKALKRNNQFVISTHSMAIMTMFKDLYDMENREWVKSDDYIKSFVS